LKDCLKECGLRGKRGRRGENVSGYSGPANEGCKKTKKPREEKEVRDGVAWGTFWATGLTTQQDGELFGRYMKGDEKGGNDGRGV